MDFFNTVHYYKEKNRKYDQMFYMIGDQGHKQK
jgi:hypothetical protein